MVSSRDPPGGGGKAEDPNRFTFRIFTLSAVDCQKLEGVRSTDGPPKAFDTLAATEVPDLRWGTVFSFDGLSDSSSKEAS